MVFMRHQIYLNDETSQKLKDYAKTKYGKHRAISIIVQQAVDEFLEREKVTEEKKKLPK